MYHPGVMTHGSVLQSAIHASHIQKYVDETNYETLPILDWNLSQAYSYTDSTEKPIIGLLKNFKHNEVDITCALYALNRKGFGELLRISNGFPINENCYNIATLSPEFIDISEFNDISLNIKTSNPIAPACVLRASEKNRYTALQNKLKAKYEAPIALEDDVVDWSCLQPIYETAETYSLDNSPRLPHFSTGNKSEDEFLREVCYNALKKKKLDNPKYRERLSYELETFKSSEMSGYFLIMWDICKFIEDSGSTLGQGRGCLSPDTLIASNNQFKRIDTVEIGDLVPTIDGSLQKVQKVWKYKCDEKMVNYKSFFGSCKGASFTYDHKIWVKKAVKNPKYGNPHTKISKFIGYKDPEWVRAESLECGDMVWTPKTKRDYLLVSGNLDLSLYDNGLNLKSSKKTCLHVQKNPLTGGIKTLREYSRFLDKDEDFYYILGMFMGDGWWSKNKNSVGFGFHSENKKHCLDKVENWCKKYKFDYTVLPHKTKKLTQIFINSPHLLALYKELYNKYDRTSQTKHVPEEIFYIKEEFIKSFIQGYQDTDGSVGRCKIKFSTVSKEIYQSFKYLMNILGHPCSTSYSEKTDKRNGKESVEYVMSIPRWDFVESSYCVKLKDGYWSRIREIEEVESTGHVYDLQVSNNHNYLTDSGLVHNSAAGCLASYLLGVTKVDPIKYDLIFERFYNPERKGVPDIDCDIVPEFRPKVIQYLREKYGEGKVAQLCTYGTFKGRGALKEILKQSGMSHAESNKVTECLHEEAKIDPQLKDQQKELGTKSVILYTLMHSRRLDFWCKFNKRTGKYTGKWAEAFKLAVEMDRTNVSIGKHASAFILSDRNLIDQCPVIPDPANGPHPVCGWEMNAAERSGLVKLDLLGLDCLSKYQQSRKSISNKSIYLEKI